MIKSLKKDDVSSIPFVVSKQWIVSNKFNENLLLADTASNTIAVQFSNSGSNWSSLGTKITSSGLESNPYDSISFHYNLNLDTFVTDSNCSILLEQDQKNFSIIQDGIQIGSSVPFNVETEEINFDDSFKRIIYNQTYNSFYDLHRGPTKLLGLNNLDILLDKKNRIVHNKLKSITIPQIYIGDQILENSIEIIDDGGDQTYSVIDDGTGNLLIKDNIYSEIISDQVPYTPTASNTFNLLYQNIGYSVSINDSFSVIGSPSFDSYFPSLTSSIGYVDVYKFDDLIQGKYTFRARLTKQTSDNFILFTELSSSATGSQDITTETSSSSGDPQDIIVFGNNNLGTIESSFGKSVDLWSNYLAVGTTNFKYVIDAGITGSYSGSYAADSFVDVYNLNDLSLPPYSIAATDISSTYNTSSYGWSVSINSQFLVVGAPLSYVNKGSIYIYTGSYSNGYVFHSQISGSSDVSGSFFGKCLKLDKNYNKLVVGNGSNIVYESGSVYLFEYDSTQNKWLQTQRFQPTRSVGILNFEPLPPYTSNISQSDGFGNSVSIYCSSSTDVTIVVGAPYDRTIQEFSGSALHKNGCVYVYEKVNCYNTVTSSYYNTTKLYGNENILKDNRFGHSVDVSGNKILISSPKFFSEFSSSYINNTILWAIDCNASLNQKSNGQFYLYEKTGSNWDVLSNYTSKKIYGYPYKFFAYNVSLFNSNFIVGNPIVSMDSNRLWTVDSSSVQFLKNIKGDFGIYNILDYLSPHHIGNVFYKNGKIVLSTSGSIFDTIFCNHLSQIPEYEIHYKSKDLIYEKEIICTANPGEFNFSTNPTSYSIPTSSFKVGNNSSFTFSDCDKLLRFINLKMTSNSSENWWNRFNYDLSINDFQTKFSDPLLIQEKSIFDFYTNQSPLTSSLTTTDFNNFYTLYNSTLDINGDGISDYLDLTLLWKYFCTSLSSQNFNSYINNKSIRKIYTDVLDYLNIKTGKNFPTEISSNFYNRYSTNFFNVTSSYLAPYITTIGLYNGADLVGVAKLGTPIKNTGDFPLNFMIRFDI